MQPHRRGPGTRASGGALLSSPTAPRPRSAMDASSVSKAATATMMMVLDPPPSPSTPLTYRAAASSSACAGGATNNNNASSQHQQQQQHAPSSKTSKGFWAHIANAQRRWRSHHPVTAASAGAVHAKRESFDTLLPTTYKGSSSNNNLNHGAAADTEDAAGNTASNTAASTTKGKPGSLHQRTVTTAGHQRTSSTAASSLHSSFSNIHIHTPGFGGSLNNNNNNNNNHHPAAAASSAVSRKTCNSFLLGGHYYPGKDKKRRLLRRKTLWHRIFFSSPGRKMATLFCLVYVAIFHVALPLGSWAATSSSNSNTSGWTSALSRLGRRQKMRGGAGVDGTGDDVLAGLQHDPNLRLSSLQQERANHRSLESERARRRAGVDDDTGKGKGIVSDTPRKQVLERIAPSWYHRNDVPGDALVPGAGKDGDAPAGTGDTEGTAAAGEAAGNGNDRSNGSNKNDHVVRNAKKRRSKTDRPPKGENDNVDHDDSNQGSAAIHDGAASFPVKPTAPAATDGGAGAEPRRILQVKGGTSGGGLPFRTIHNMGAVALERSSCGGSNSSSTDIAQTQPQITLVTQTSINRLWILNETCTRWRDPIVAVVFVPWGDDGAGAEGDGEKTSSQLLLETTQRQLLPPEEGHHGGGGDDPPHPCPNLRIVHYLADADESLTGNYPVNRLRNVGLDHASTSHVLVMDVDFVPSQDLDRHVRDGLVAMQQRRSRQTTTSSASSYPTALIVPAFERKLPVGCLTDVDCASHLQSNSSFLPHTFAELQGCVQMKDCVVFQSENNWEGHSTTRSEEWMQKLWYDDEEDKAQEDNGIPLPFRKVKCFHTARYEPYVVLEWCPRGSSSRGDGPSKAAAAAASPSTAVAPLAPYYDERFHGYGKNKIELISHLRKSGYRFEILPEGFIVHNPHLESKAKEAWNGGDIGVRSKEDLHSKMDSLYSKFMKELDDMYREVHNSTVKLCRHQ